MLKDHVCLTVVRSAMMICIYDVQRLNRQKTKLEVAELNITGSETGWEGLEMSRSGGQYHAQRNNPYVYSYG